MSRALGRLSASLCLGLSVLVWNSTPWAECGGGWGHSSHPTVPGREFLSSVEAVWRKDLSANLSRGSPVSWVDWPVELLSCWASVMLRWVAQGSHARFSHCSYWHLVDLNKCFSICWMPLRPRTEILVFLFFVFPIIFTNYGCFTRKMVCGSPHVIFWKMKDSFSFHFMWSFFFFVSGFPLGLFFAYCPPRALFCL